MINLKRLRVITLILVVVMVLFILGCQQDSDSHEAMRKAMLKHLKKKYKGYKEVPYGLDITKRWM